MGVKQVATAIDKEIAAALINVVPAVILTLLSFAQQAPIEFQRGGRKDLKPRKPLQRKSVIGGPLWIGEYDKRPLMVLLIERKPLRLGEGDHDDRNPAGFELIFGRFHLAEVGLARQSGEMSKKDQQKVMMKALGELYRVAVQIEQGQTIEGYLFH